MIRSGLLVAVSAATLAAQAPFEGGITISVPGMNGQSMVMSYLVKAGKIRVEMPGGRGAMVVDNAAQKMLMIMTPQKMYSEIDMKAAVTTPASKKPAKVNRTGKMETIAGYRCEHIIITADDGAESDVCLSSALGSFRMPSATGRGSVPQDWETALGEAGFPLRVQRGQKTVLEVTKIEKMSLDASLFTAPDGFTKMGAGGRRGGG